MATFPTQIYTDTEQWRKTTLKSNLGESTVSSRSSNSRSDDDAPLRSMYALPYLPPSARIDQHVLCISTSKRNGKDLIRLFFIKQIADHLHVPAKQPRIVPDVHTICIANTPNQPISN
ncbi:Dynein beta chain, ciliary [Gossypium arboreum]|uniref:Dynein beta chain, ciliary n=1 Tax=Gossypium arboreum TaxID=29729 RepID=A0A0B0NBN0_GOSAR|nr:Dynein beta chain, ciliary [Gossypium arboreum]